MDWLRRSLRRIQRTSVIGSALQPTVHNQSQNITSQDLKRRGQLNSLRDRNTSWSYSSDNVFQSEEVSSVQNIFHRLGMRLKKDYKIRSREGTRAMVKPEILKVRKTHSKSFKSPIVRPKRAKSKSSWVQRLLSKSSNNNNDRDVSEHFSAVEIEVEEAVHEVYSNQFMHSEHFNFVGEDKNLGPLVLSIKYRNRIVDKGRQKMKVSSVPGKTILLLRLPTGLVKHTWNQFQLTNPSLKSPLDLAKLSFPNLAVSRLLPVLSPEVSQLIAQFDRLSAEETKAEREVAKIPYLESKTMELKELQEKLITSTCKFIELSNWDLKEYDDFFTKKKMNLPKYLSFTMPVTLKTPKSSTRSANRVKSPKFMSLPKRILQFEDDQSSTSPPPPLNLKPSLKVNYQDLVENSDCLGSCQLSLEAAVASDHMVDLSLTGQMVKLTTSDSIDEAIATDLEAIATDDDDMVVNMMMTMVKLKLEKEEMSETNAELEREKEELAKNGRRLVRELATAHTIIDSLKKRLQN